MRWPSCDPDSADKVWTAGRATVAEAIARVMEGVDDRSRTPRDKGLYYNGFGDASKVFPGFGTQVSEYYRAARELGDWQVKASKAIKAELAGDTLSEQQKTDVSELEYGK
ncbi:hypothetical protein BJX65DRAFT_302608 [Aspergillus insuetus]